MREGMRRGNQARITSAHATAVSRGIDGQEEEQTAGCLYRNDRIQSQVRDVAPQPCESGAIHTSAYPPTPLRARSPTRVVPGLARRQPHLRQTSHALSSNACRSTRAA